MRQSNQITLRGLDPRVLRALKGLAKAQRLSLNQAALLMLESAAGLSEPRSEKAADRIGSSLDSWIGTWSQAEADELLASIRSCEQIDDELWG